MLAVLCGALLHASWNALVKSTGDPLVQTGLVNLGCLVIALAALPLLRFPAPASWPCIAASSLLQLAYLVLIGAAYRAGDMSLAYPLMRGTAPLLVAVFGSLALGEALSPPAWTGVALVCGGVLATALARHAAGRQWRSVGFALANAVVIASYTWVDGTGVRLSGSPAGYTLAIIVFPAGALAAWLHRRHPCRLGQAVRRSWALGLAGGGCVLGSYGLALWAMTRAAIAPVAALRETSILFGLLLARLVLRERLTAGRAIGGVLILAGAIVLRLA